MRDALPFLLIAGAVSLHGCTHSGSVERSWSGAKATLVEVGKGPIDIATGDLNGDRRLDLVAAVTGKRGVAVALQGANGWTVGDPLPVPVDPHLVAVADLNADGCPDILATAHDSGSVWAWLGDGKGGFTPATGSPFTAFRGERPHNHGLVAGDLDGDGDADVVASDQDARAAAVLLWDGTALAATPASPIDLGAQSYPPALGDVNGDGKLDLVAPLVGGHAIAILEGNGQGGFEHRPGSPRRTDLARPYGIALGDLDGSGTLDIVACHDDTDRITVFLSSKDGELRLGPGSPQPLGRRVGSRMKLADVDRDGNIDLVAAGGGHLVVARGDGRGGLTPHRAEPLGDGWAATAADFDGDGTLDLAAGDMSGSAVRIWLQTP